MDLPTILGFLGGIIVVAIVIGITVWMIVFGVGVFVAMCLMVGLVGLLAFMPVEHAEIRRVVVGKPTAIKGPLYGYKLLRLGGGLINKLQFVSPFMPMKWTAGWNGVVINPDRSSG